MAIAGHMVLHRYQVTSDQLLLATYQQTLNTVTLSARTSLLVIIVIHRGLRPLARVDLAFEQNVNLTVGPTFHLRQAEPGCHQTDESRSTPDVATLSTNYYTLASDVKTA